ncbi:hypothetical protein GCM10010978_06020 [Compostibacillus humi]|jgi:hypothetical protein|uniref:YugN-like family protein n=1 Tax=Compostibacillus humi TaxID=1245525 RepID=A0A8J2ZQ63_9BACI|nr:YugN family protein [Compostibacillus humi]GGH70757.1 hypothetical protein GCM10010978_06020 [Compostibacillus humi]HLT56953.1 YugN family protein [Bacillota bacterium]
MLILNETEIEGKQMYFGEAKRDFKKMGLVIGDSWDYHKGVFDGVMHKEGGETIYIRLPFRVVEGELDRQDALIEFQKPFIVKHVVNLGLDTDENALLTVTGLSQFQKPLDTDGYIHDKSKWVEFGEETIGDILNRLEKMKK